MINIKLSNSTCQVFNLGKSDYAALQEHLSYIDQAIDYSFQRIIKNLRYINTMLQNKNLGTDEGALKRQRILLIKEADEIDKLRKITLINDNIFPSGLLPRVLDWLTVRELKYDLEDLRIEPKRNSVKIMTKVPFPELRYYQLDAIDKFNLDGRGIVVLPTGTGKSILCAKIIWELGVKTLIITPNKSITDMMEEVMSKHFGTGLVEVLNTKTTKIKKAISICNIQALIKINPEVFINQDAVIIDEFHHSSASTYQEVNLKHLKNTYFRLGLTATNFRNDGSDLALEGVLSEVLYEYEIPKAIKDGFLVKPEFIIMANGIQIQETNYQKVYKKGIVLNEDRNSTIAEIAEREKDAKTIILVQYKEHGEILKGLIPWAEFIHGEEKDSDRERMMKDFKDGDLKCLIGTSVIGEGVDLPCAEVLIMAGGGKARSQVIQNIGRVLRIYPGKEKAIIYDFRDLDGGFLEEHSIERSLIYTDYIVT